MHGCRGCVGFQRVRIGFFGYKSSSWEGEHFSLTFVFNQDPFGQTTLPFLRPCLQRGIFSERLLFGESESVLKRKHFFTRKEDPN